MASVGESLYCDITQCRFLRGKMRLSCNRVQLFGCRISLDGGKRGQGMSNDYSH